MTNKLRLAFGAGAAVLLAAGAAVYAHPGGDHGPMKMFDADSNGAISLAEARAGAAKMFAGADADKDGRVTEAEMRAFHGSMGGHHGGGHGGPAVAEGDHGPMHLDSDGDGAVTLTEAQSGIERHFAQVDSNGDGSISAEEMQAAHRSHRP